MKSLDEAVEAMVRGAGFDEVEIARREAFLEFTSEDAARLHGLRGVLRTLAPEFANAYCEHLLAFEETRRFIPDVQSVERLKRIQAAYLESLAAGGDHDPAHVSHRLRVGLAHQRIGLEPKWYLGAYGKYLGALLPELWRQFGKDPEAFVHTCQALVKRMLLDIGLAVDAYVQAGRQSVLALKEYAEMAFASIPDGLMVLSSDLVILSANRSVLKQFGLTARSVLGRRLTEVIAAEGLEERILQVLSSGVARHDVPFDMGVAGNDVRKPVRVTLSGIRLAEEEEEEARLILVVKDVSEEQRLREQARANEERYQSLVQGLDAIVWEADAGTFAFTFVSRRAEAILGYPVERWAAQPDFRAGLIHPQDRERVLASWRAAVAQGSVALDYRAVAADGRVVWLHDIVRVVRDERGRLRQLRGITVDITERKQAEEHIRLLNDSLERKVAERTVELAAANKELESFAYSASHDLRTPLRGIDGFSHLLAEEYGDRLDERGRDYLVRVRAATRQMAQLIDDLLELSRLTRSTMRREPVDLSALAQSIAGELRESQPERQAEFVIAPGLAVDGDAMLLRVALLNLLGNAWKYTGKKPLARIEMGATAIEGKPAYFVRDNGAGFDVAYASKLFQPFQRLHKPAEFEGSGIGLATVRRIVERHGGRVWAEAAHEAGATFFFTLP